MPNKELRHRYKAAGKCTECGRRPEIRRTKCTRHLAIDAKYQVGKRKRDKMQIALGPDAG